MRILTIGGTQFIGRHFVRAALDGGHDVTIFHRGRTGAGLFPEAAHLTGDRDRDLGALAAGRWDATVDFCAYLAPAGHPPGRGPGRARRAAPADLQRVGVRAGAAPGFGEDAPLIELADPEAEELTEPDVRRAQGGVRARRPRRLRRRGHDDRPAHLRDRPA